MVLAVTLLTFGNACKKPLPPSEILVVALTIVALTVSTLTVAPPITISPVSAIKKLLYAIVVLVQESAGVVFASCVIVTSQSIVLPEFVNEFGGLKFKVKTISLVLPVVLFKSEDAVPACTIDDISISTSVDAIVFIFTDCKSKLGV